MSIIFLFFYSCWLLFLDFLRLLCGCVGKVSKIKPRPQKAEPEDNQPDEFNKLLTLEELLEDNEQ